MKKGKYKDAVDSKAFAHLKEEREKIVKLSSQYKDEELPEKSREKVISLSKGRKDDTKDSK